MTTKCIYTCYYMCIINIYIYIYIICLSSKQIFNSNYACHREHK